MNTLTILQHNVANTLGTKQTHAFKHLQRNKSRHNTYKQPWSNRQQNTCTLAHLGLIHTGVPVTLRSRSDHGTVTVLGYSHLRSALAPFTVQSFPLPRHQYSLTISYEGCVTFRTLSWQ